MFITEIYTALNVAAVIAAVDTHENVAAIFYGNVIPADCTVEKTINFYSLGAVNYAIPYAMGKVSVNCRARTQYEAELIALTVITAVNEKSYTNYFITCQLEQTVPPADETDNFNSPVTITIKKRGF